MPKSSFQCPKCSRTFAMAAHLARHLSAGHGGGGARPAAAPKAKPTGARRGRPPKSASSAAIGGAAGIVGQMQAYHNQLLSQRASLDGQIDAISSALAALGAAGGAAAAARPAAKAPTGARRGRPPGKRSGGGGGGGRRQPGASLKDYIIRVLRATSSPLGVKDIATQVMRVGYETASKDLTKAVSNMLPSIKEVKKVDRGLYRA